MTPKIHLCLLWLFCSVLAGYASSGDGLLIKQIQVIRYSDVKNGKKVDKDGFADLYFRLYQDAKEIARTEIKDNCRLSVVHTFAGKGMPFRIEQNKSYYLELRDHDKDTRINSNKDEALTSKIPVRWELLIRKGKQPTYELRDDTNRFVAILHVEHVDGNTASGEKAYVRYVKPIDQMRVPPKNKVLEGCGPIAAAMLMGYWHTEHGYKMMDAADRFNGTAHPWKTIEAFRNKANTKAWGDQDQSATRKMKMEDALGYFVKKANEATPGKPKLKVDMLWSIRRWEERRDVLKRELKQGSPLILLLKKMPPCLNGSWVNATKVFGDHYIVVNGFDDAKKEYYVMPGWEERTKSTTSGPQAHSERNLSHCTCSYKEIKESDPSLIWIKR